MNDSDIFNVDLDEFNLENFYEELGKDMPSTSSRFASMNEDDMARDVENAIPGNTLKKAKWAISILRTWHNEWKVRMTVVTRFLKTWRSGVRKS